MTMLKSFTVCSMKDIEYLCNSGFQIRGVDYVSCGLSSFLMLNANGFIHNIIAVGVLRFY